MPSHLSSIGFPAVSKEDVMAVIQRAAREGLPIPSRKGEYVLWAPGGGPELWVQIETKQKGQRTLAGFHPHFRGQARMKFGATGAKASEAYPLEGVLYGWVDPEDENPESGAFPISLDVPDFELAMANVTFPRNVDIQVAAFAHTATCFLDQDALARDGLKMGGPGMAAKSFIPLGAFKGQQPSTGLFCGEILEAEVKINPATGGTYQHLLVETLGGQIDVVADLTVLSGETRIGRIVQCEGWLSARLAM